MKPIPYRSDKMVEAAGAYVRRGWFVIPLCWPTADGKCGCHKNHVKEKEIGKAPLLGDDYQDCRSTEEDVRRWWTDWPQANIGILLGPSGLFVIDTDSEEAWREANAKGLPEGPQVRSGKGRHVYCRAREGLYGRTAKRGDARTIDVLASGYVVAPPSVHKSGAGYRWLALPEEAPLQDPPPWAVALLAERASAKRQVVEFADDLPRISIDSLPMRRGIKDLIRDGLLHHPSRSEAVYAVEMALIEAGCDDATIASVLLDPRSGISEKPREKGREWLAGEIGRARAKGPSAAESEPLGQGAKGEDCFELLDDEEIESLPSPEWLIEDILPSEALAVLYGPPKIGKTFLGLDWAFSICTGRPWCGHAVKAGAVMYVYSEGSGKLKCRTRAWKQSHGVGGKLGVQFITRAVNLLNQREVNRLNRTICKLPVPPKLIVLDTLARCIEGGDENSARDVGALVGVADRLRAEFKTTVLIIHHSGKNGDERGSTALRGAADTMLKLTEDSGGVMILHCEAQKDARDFKPLLLERQEVDLGNGESSCVLQLADQMKNEGDLRSGFLNKNQRNALKALHGFGSAGAESTKWRKAIPWSKPTGIPKTTFKRIRDELDRHKYVEKNGSLYTVTAKGELVLSPIADLGSEGEHPEHHPHPRPTPNAPTSPEAGVEHCEDEIIDDSGDPQDLPMSAGSTVQMGPQAVHGFLVDHGPSRVPGTKGSTPL